MTIAIPWLHYVVKEVFHQRLQDQKRADYIQIFFRDIAQVIETVSYALLDRHIVVDVIYFITQSNQAVTIFT